MSGQLELTLVLPQNAKRRRRPKRVHPFDAARARAMPLEEFPAEHRRRIEALVARDRPPARYIILAGGLAMIESRAWYEWYWQRGARPDREKLSPTLRRAVIVRDGLVCGICRGAVPPDDVHVDHVTPVIRGGRNVLSNLRVTHSVCNLRKGAS